ncbi:MAG: hypothetical protein AAGA03_08185, partial [Planctomycetota bacterium]
MLLLIMACPGVGETLVVDSDFPGGSGERVPQESRPEDSDLQQVTIRPSSSSGDGWPCWWYVRLQGLTPGKPLFLTVQ